MPVQPRQVIRKPEPCRGGHNTARRQAASRVQVDAMHGRGVLALTLEQVKILASIHGQVDVYPAHLTTQTLDGVCSQEGIDLIENGARLVLQHEAVLKYLTVQGWCWQEPQLTNLL